MIYIINFSTNDKSSSVLYSSHIFVIRIIDSFWKMMLIDSISSIFKNSSIEQSLIDSVTKVQAKFLTLSIRSLIDIRTISLLVAKFKFLIPK